MFMYTERAWAGQSCLRGGERARIVARNIRSGPGIKSSCARIVPGDHKYAICRGQSLRALLYTRPRAALILSGAYTPPSRGTSRYLSCALGPRPLLKIYLLSSPALFPIPSCAFSPSLFFSFSLLLRFFIFRGLFSPSPSRAYCALAFIRVFGRRAPELCFSLWALFRLLPFVLETYPISICRDEKITAAYFLNSLSA